MSKITSHTIVACRFEGSGRVWPLGAHYRAGRVLKSGPAGGWLVQIFRPIMELDRATGEWQESSVITCHEDEMTVISSGAE